MTLPENARLQEREKLGRFARPTPSGRTDILHSVILIRLAGGWTKTASGKRSRAE